MTKNVTNKVVIGQNPPRKSIQDLGQGQMFRYNEDSGNVYLKTDLTGDGGKPRIVNLRTGAFYTPNSNPDVILVTEAFTIVPNQG